MGLLLHGLVAFLMLSDVLRPADGGTIVEFAKDIKDKALKLYKHYKEKAENLFSWGSNTAFFVVPSTESIRRSHYKFVASIRNNADVATLEELLMELGRVAHYMRLYKKFAACKSCDHGTYRRSFPNYIKSARGNQQVQKFCTENVEKCIHAIYDFAKSSFWYSWNFFDNFKNVDDPTLKKSLAAKILRFGKTEGTETFWREVTESRFLIYTEPFVTTNEQETFFVTASYFLCWYTMLRVPIMAHLPYCNFTEHIHASVTLMKGDEEDTASVPVLDFLDPEPFRCAQFSFCPNPCCDQQDMYQECDAQYSDDDLHESESDVQGNPCLHLEDKRCFIEGKRNENLVDLIRNHFNKSCHCGKGFEFNNVIQECMDIDECFHGTYNCSIFNQHGACVELTPVVLPEEQETKSLAVKISFKYLFGTFLIVLLYLL